MTTSRVFEHRGFVNQEPHNPSGAVLVAAPGVGKRIIVRRIDAALLPFSAGTAQAVPIRFYAGTSSTDPDQTLCTMTLTHQTPGMSRVWKKLVDGFRALRENSALSWVGTHSGGAGQGFVTFLVDYYIETVQASSDGGAERDTSADTDGLASFELAYDGTKGIYWKTFANVDGTAPFQPQALFSVSLYNRFTGLVEEKTSTSSWKISTVTAGARTVLTAVLLADTDVVVKLAFTREARRVRVVLEEARGSPRNVVMAVLLSLSLNPATVGASSSDDFYLGHNYAGGFTLRRPNQVNVGLVEPMGGCQWNSFWNAANGQAGGRMHVYLSSDDTEHTPKLASFTESGGNCVFTFQWLCDRRFQFEKIWSRPNFGFSVEVFRGNMLHGSLEGQEAAAKYAEWADDPDHPWNANGDWKDAGDTLANEVDIYVTGAGWDKERWLDDMPKWLSQAGCTRLVVQYYGWKNPGSQEGDLAEVYTPQYTHDGPLEDEVLDIFDLYGGLGIVLTPYVDGWIFDSRVNDPDFTPETFRKADDSVVDLTPYLMRKRDGSVRVVSVNSESEAQYGPGTLRELDYGAGEDFAEMLAEEWYAGVRAAIGNRVLLGIYDDGNGSGMVAPALMSLDPSGSNVSEYNDDPAATTWTYAGFVRGKQARIRRYLELLKAANSGVGMVAQEWPAELSLGISLWSAQKSRFTGLGNFSSWYARGHGNRTRIYAYDNCPLATLSVVISSFYVTWVTDGWLTMQGLIAINDINSVTDPDETFFAADMTTKWDYYLELWIRTKLLNAKAMCAPYFQGRLYRQLVEDYMVYRNETLDTASAQEWRYLSDSTMFLRSETYRVLATGALGIIVTYAYPSAAVILPAHAGGFPDLPAVSKTIRINRAENKLSAGTWTVYRRTDGGARVLVGTFTEELSFNATFQRWTVSLFEVVKE